MTENSTISETLIDGIPLEKLREADKEVSRTQVRLRKEGWSGSDANQLAVETQAAKLGIQSAAELRSLLGKSRWAVWRLANPEVTRARPRKKAETKTKSVVATRLEQEGGVTWVEVESREIPVDNGQEKQAEVAVKPENVALRRFPGMRPVPVEEADLVFLGRGGDPSTLTGQVREALRKARVRKGQTVAFGPMKSPEECRKIQVVLRGAVRGIWPQPKSKKDPRYLSAYGKPDESKEDYWLYVKRTT